MEEYYFSVTGMRRRLLARKAMGAVSLPSFDANISSSVGLIESCVPDSSASPDGFGQQTISPTTNVLGNFVCDRSAGSLLPIFVRHLGESRSFRRYAAVTWFSITSHRLLPCRSVSIICPCISSWSWTSTIFSSMYDCCCPGGTGSSYPCKY